VLQSEGLKEALVTVGSEGTQNFDPVYTKLVHWCFEGHGRGAPQTIEQKLKKFIGNSLHTKLFLLGLFMSLNSVDRSYIEKSRVLCLSLLPLVMVSPAELKT
jgi:hypothetical protein